MTRSEDVRAAEHVPYRLLEAQVELDGGDGNGANMLIQGDNLEALKALLPYYAGRVKCIYIDPPYNTRSAFEHYDDNLEHSQWLAMIYPRLVLLRDLLAEDGSIWVSIDDNEAHYLKVVLDEVFGRANFVGSAIWQKKYTVANDAKWLSDNHDHILIYATNKERWRPRRLPRSEEMNARYRNPDNHSKGPWKATPLYAKRSGSEKEKAFTFTFKNGYVWKTPPGTSPRFPAEALARMDANDEIWFGADGRAQPSRKTFLSDLAAEGPPAPTVWLHSEVGHNHEARDEVKRLSSDDPFTTPKPERLLHRIIHLATSEGDLVLDSFLGSGTTVAVAHKMGRRWIGIEMGEHAVTHCKPRLDKVIAGEQGGVSEAVGWSGGGGYRFYRLGDAVFDADGSIADGIRFPTLAAHIWFSETRAPYPGDGSSPVLGVYEGTAYALLYNGILGDRSVTGGNVLTSAVLDRLRADANGWSGPMVIYGEASRLGAPRLKDEQVTFKQTPYDVRAR
jgi:adenine-specific DNA-methyltransferase